MQAEIYDYIICGAGCAGLSLAYYLSQKNLGKRKVLIIDQDHKNTNDRTWCFWDREASDFDDILDTSWSKIQFHHPAYSRKYDIEPYIYKKIKGIDFYNKVIPIIKSHPNFYWVKDSINKIEEGNSQGIVHGINSNYYSPLIFNSIGHKKYGSHHAVLQHFKGWFVKTTEDQFDPSIATYMDFRTDQEGGIRFFYVLPTSAREALIEVAIFSNDVLDSDTYDQIIKEYIDTNLSLSSFHIEEEEMGIIPMTTYPFEKLNSKHIKNIGTAGGWVKASSGFAFKRIQDYAKSLATALVDRGGIDSTLRAVHNRYRFYDKIFLNVLLSGKAKGDQVFLDMFKKLPPQLIFKFLDEDTSFFEDLKVFTAPPFTPFIKALKEELF